MEDLPIPRCGRSVLVNYRGRGDFSITLNGNPMHCPRSLLQPAVNFVQVRAVLIVSRKLLYIAFGIVSCRSSNSTITANYYNNSSPVDSWRILGDDFFHFFLLAKLNKIVGEWLWDDGKMTNEWVLNRCWKRLLNWVIKKMEKSWNWCYAIFGHWKQLWRVLMKMECFWTFYLNWDLKNSPIIFQISKNDSYTI